MTYFQKNPLLYKEKPADSVKMNEEFQQVYGILNEMKTEQDSHDIHDATEATTVADNDEFGFVYAVTSVLKKIKWSNIKAVLKTYFDTLYSVLGHTHPGTDVTSAVANATTAESCSGNAATATKLATARTISLTGDVTGSASFDGSDNAAITATVADDSHNHVISNVDGLQTALDGKPNILSERSLSVTTTNWVTIATCSTRRAYGEFYVYDGDSSGHNMVKIIASTSFGQNAVVALCGNRFSSRTIAHVRILYNTADRTYGGAKLQVYCENPTFLLRVRRVFTDQLPGWTSWNDVNPVVEGTPSGWAEDSTTRFDDITSTAYSLNGNLSGNATGLKVSTWATVQTNYGNIQFGPANGSFAHIYTDRPSFYFNKPLLVNGTAVSLNGHTHAYLPTTGKAADSDKLDGYNSASAGTASTVPVRDSAGDITTRLFRSTYANQATISGALAFRVNTTDNYIRFCSNMAAVRTFIGCAATSHTHSYVPIPTSNYMAVGCWAMLVYQAAATLANGSSTAGSNLRQPYASSVPLNGTWKNITGASVPQYGGGTFVRTA